MHKNAAHLPSKFKLMLALLSPSSFFATTRYLPASVTFTSVILKTDL